MEKPVAQSGMNTGAHSERRRSQRLLLAVPIAVEGESQEGRLFHEETRTLIVNAHGALLTLAMKVEIGQALVLKNQKSQEKRPCKVAHVGTSLMGKAQVAVEFMQPAPHFWHIAFPPEDWTALESKTPGPPN